MKYQECENCGKNVGRINFTLNFILAVFKLIVGFTSGSKGCIADALHSFACTTTSFAILLSQKISKKQSNKEFHYGYGKIEFLAAGLITFLIILFAIVLILLSLKHLITSSPDAPPHLTALLAALVSIIVNEMMFRYMRCVGTQLKSQTIIASSLANRADCFSSIAVLVGVTLSQLGFHNFDPIAAILIVFIIIKICYTTMIDSVKALMDVSANDVYGPEIMEVLSNIDKLHSISSVKTRQIGNKIWAEIDIIVLPDLTIKDSQNIALMVKQTLLSKIKDLESVLVNFASKTEEINEPT
ncbi:MAG: cation transporter [Desulfobacterales bacterium]|nr:cation transporter [Desulfobacterales bacterium]